MKNKLIIVKFNEIGFLISRSIIELPNLDDVENIIKDIEKEHNTFIVDSDADYYLKDNVLKIIPPNTNNSNYYFNIVQEKWVINTLALQRELRTKRNKLLVDSDYIELPSTQLRMTDEKLNEWLEYRQALRDITTQTDLENIIWPIKP